MTFSTVLRVYSYVSRSVVQKGNQLPKLLRYRTPETIENLVLLKGEIEEAGKARVKFHLPCYVIRENKFACSR